MISGTVTQGRRRRTRGSYVPFSVRWLDWMILLLISAIPIAGIWLFGGVHVWSIGPMLVAVFLAGILFVYRYFISPYRDTLLAPPGGVFFLLILLYFGCLYIVSDLRYDARMETLRLVAYAAALWMWMNVARINQRWLLILVLLMLSVSVMAWYAMIQEVHNSNMVLNRIRPEQYGMRASGAYICPNHFANLLEMIFPICLGFVICRDIGLPARLIAGYTALVSLPPLYLSESRSGWLGFLVGFVVFALALALKKGVKRFVIMLILAPLIAGAVGYTAWKLSPRVQERVEAAIKGDIRTVLWKDTVDVIKRSPIIGSGLGSYKWVFAISRNHFTKDADPEYAHNDYLHMWAEAGIVGLALMGVFVLLVVIRSTRILLVSANQKDVVLMGGLLGAMAGALVHAVFDFNFHIVANTHVFFMLIGALAGATFNAGGVDRSFNMMSRFAPAIGIALIIGMAFLCLVVARDVVSHHYVEQGQTNVGKMAWDRAEVEFQNAISWSPDNWRAHIGMAHLLRTRSFWMRDPVVKAAWIETSRKHYEEALRLNPWEADVYFGLGGLARLEGDQETALYYRRLAVEKVPRHTFYLNELGLQLRHMGRYQEALEVFIESRSVSRTNLADNNIEWLGRRLGGAP